MRRTIYWIRELRGSGAVLLERGEVRGGHMMAQKFHLVHTKNTLVQVNCEAMITAELKDLLKMMLMRNEIWRIDENIIQIDKTKGMVTKDIIYPSLERLSCIPKAKRRHRKSNRPKGVTITVLIIS